jgi:hypothetical protein
MVREKLWDLVTAPSSREIDRGSMVRSQGICKRADESGELVRTVRDVE